MARSEGDATMRPMPVPPVGLEARARRAYEWGRLGAALRRAWPVVPLAMVSIAGCGRPALAAGVAGILLVAVVALGWRGQGWGRAVPPGLAAGVVPLVLPLIVRATGHGCAMGAGICWSVCLVACGAGGAIAGVALGLRAARVESDRRAFVVAGAIVAGLTGALGCVVAGVAGIAGMAVGFVVATMPVLVGAAARRG